jgi:hypothetical protein
MIANAKNMATAGDVRAFSESHFQPSTEAEVRLNAVNRERRALTDRSASDISGQKSLEQTSDFPSIEYADTPFDRFKVIDFPTFEPLPEKPNQSFAALQIWEGVVTDVLNDTVYADLVDVSANERNFGEIVEIPISELTEVERERAVRGAVFRLTIGYFRTNGTLMNSSMIRFRRSSTPLRTAKEPPPLEFETDE